MRGHRGAPAYVLDDAGVSRRSQEAAVQARVLGQVREESSTDGTRAWTTAGSTARHWTTNAPLTASLICGTGGAPLTERRWHRTLPEFGCVPLCS
ncbi:hypothetical protein [Streptomyces sp. NPDC046909]|uniref:hypothetical protein n=1 Tax=Streptomyces sp. NPDC046909 TaxID=3155617 RepID=UPI0033BFE6F7